MLERGDFEGAVRNSEGLWRIPHSSVFNGLAPLPKEPANDAGTAQQNNIETAPAAADTSSNGESPAGDETTVASMAETSPSDNGQAAVERPAALVAQDDEHVIDCRQRSDAIGVRLQEVEERLGYLAEAARQQLRNSALEVEVASVRRERDQLARRLSAADRARAQAPASEAVPIVERLQSEIVEQQRRIARLEAQLMAIGQEQIHLRNAGTRRRWLRDR